MLGVPIPGNLDRHGLTDSSTCAPTRVHMDDSHSTFLIAEDLLARLAGLCAAGEPELAVVCIGTDRSTGDALGPLVGSWLVENALPRLQVSGTLDQPIHAANLGEWLKAQQGKARSQTITLAVDACLGKNESVGMVSIRSGPLYPGTGVNKSLPPVGDIHMVGVVNVGGFMEYLVLQNTRLSFVARMARVMASGIWYAWSRVVGAAPSHAQRAFSGIFPAGGGPVACCEIRLRSSESASG